MFFVLPHFRTCTGTHTRAFSFSFVLSISHRSSVRSFRSPLPNSLFLRHLPPPPPLRLFRLGVDSTRQPRTEEKVLDGRAYISSPEPSSCFPFFPFTRENGRKLKTLPTPFPHRSSRNPHLAYLFSCFPHDPFKIEEEKRKEQKGK